MIPAPIRDTITRSLRASERLAECFADLPQAQRDYASIQVALTWLAWQPVERDWREELEELWPEMPEYLEGVDLFAEYPVAGVPQKEER